VANANESPIEIVRRFCAVWSNGDTDEIAEFFTDDAVYHNIPVHPVTGKASIRATIAGFTTGVESVEFRVIHIGVSGNVVMTERVDVFKMPAATVELPVMGTFELKGDKIAAWRDYFDLNQFMSQMPSP